MTTWTFEAIGTTWDIDTPLPLAENVQDAVGATIEAFDQTWSRFREDSTVSAIARASGDYVIEGAGPILDFYDALFDVTVGAVTPMIGKTLADLGYDSTYSLSPSESPSAVPDWGDVAHHGDTVSTISPVVIDIGAAGKGRLVDSVAATLRDHGVDSATVDGSGDLFHDGREPLRVALEHPRDPSKALGVVTVEPGTALCGSATNRRTWGSGLHHVIDGRTGQPTSDVVATWVVAPASCMVADGLATAHFFAPAEALVERWPDHRFVRVHADGRVLWSPNLPGDMFL